MANGYDDELSETEQAELRTLEERDRALTTTVDDKLPGVPEADSDAGNADLIAEAEAQDPANKAPPAAPADPNAPADPAAPPADTPPADETLGQFMARHRAAGKTDDEIAGLVENRGKRAAREGFQRRKGRTAEQIAADRAALATRADTLKKSDFEKQLAEDPDAAAKLLHDRQVQNDLDAIASRNAALDAEEHDALVDDALEFAHKYIEDLPEAYPKMLQFGQAIGYTPQDLDSITDGRDLLTLNMARIAGDLILAKVIDKRGNLLPQVQPTTDTPRDPRLTPPRAPAGHTAPQNSNAPVASLETQAASALSMSDDEFDKLPPETLARMMGGR